MSSMSADAKSKAVPMRQLVDWRATFIAAFIAGSVFLIFVVLVVPVVFGNGDVATAIRNVGSIILGPTSLNEAEPLSIVMVLAALVVNYAIAILGTVILAIIIHQWGLVTGIILGALFGFALYLINNFLTSQLFPWFVFNTTWFVTAHILFGAIAGGTYEALEVERFVPVEPVDAVDNH